MFQQNIKKREHIYDRILKNLSLNSQDYGISKLRRLEIRFLPLDPVLITQIFCSLSKNVMLQELILTDDCLTFASVESFSHLFTSLKSNSSTSLTLIDISRNYLVDDNLGIHAEMIDALLN